MRLNSPVVDLMASERCLTNRQLALKVGVNPRFLGRFRKGERTASLGTIQRIADVLEVPLDSILLPHRPVKEQAK